MIDVQASDPDLGDEVSIDIPTRPAGMVSDLPLPADGNPAALQLTWTPTTGQEGTHTVEITGTDLAGLSVTCTFTVEVAASSNGGGGSGCGACSVNPDSSAPGWSLGAVLVLMAFAGWQALRWRRNHGDL